MGNNYYALMSNNEETNVLRQIKTVAHQTAPKGCKMILFGSRARGEAKEDSDWDILIILSKKRLEQNDYDNVSYPFVELGWKLNEQINPIMYSQEEWEANSITPFYDNVMKDGIPLI